MSVSGNGEKRSGGDGVGSCSWDNGGQRDCGAVDYEASGAGEEGVGRSRDYHGSPTGGDGLARDDQVGARS